MLFNKMKDFIEHLIKKLGKENYKEIKGQALNILAYIMIGSMFALLLINSAMEKL